jgi:hypothetical protein
LINEVTQISETLGKLGMLSKKKRSVERSEDEADSSVSIPTKTDLDSHNGDQQTDKIGRKQKIMRRIDSWFDWWSWFGWFG